MGQQDCLPTTTQRTIVYRTLVGAAERLSEQVVRVGHMSMMVVLIPDSAPGVPASAGSGRTPAEAGTPVLGPCRSDLHPAPLLRTLVHDRSRMTDGTGCQANTPMTNLFQKVSERNRVSPLR